MLDWLILFWELIEQFIEHGGFCLINGDDSVLFCNVKLNNKPNYCHQMVLLKGLKINQDVL